MQPTVDQLEQAALHVLRLIRDAPGLANTRLALIGDLAVRRHLVHHRVRSIEFIISKSSSPGRVRKEIVGHPMSPLIERQRAIFYKTNKLEIEVKLTPDWVCPYLPTSAQAVRECSATLPYVSLEDLIIFKADACTLRETMKSKVEEAQAAAALLDLASKHSTLVLEDDKIRRMDEALDDLVEALPDHDRSWWSRRLGKPSGRDAQTILSEIAEPLPSPTSSRSSVYSSISRTSSYTSATSIASSTSSIRSDDTVSEKNGRPRKMSATAKSPRHKRHVSGSGSISRAAIDIGMQQLDIGRSASPGVALTNRI